MHNLLAAWIEHGLITRRVVPHLILGRVARSLHLLVHYEALFRL